MDTIRIDNYEAYLLDFYEGNLSGELRAQLDLFLAQHPELDVDLTELPYIPVEPITVSFPEKNSLKKTASQLVSEHDFISYIEHQLTDSEKAVVEASCANQEELAKELKQYTQTISQADLLIVYPDKEGLKRQTKVIWFNFSTRTFAAAASIALLFGLFMLWPRTQQHESLAAKHVNNFDNSMVSPEEHKALLHPTTSTSSAQRDTTPSIKTMDQILENEGSEKNIASRPLPAPQEMVPSLKPDTSGTLVSNEKKEPALPGKEELKPKGNKFVVETISESDDEVASQSKPKKGLWGFAAKALSNLNKVGVKQVDGDEEKTQEAQTTYALTFGNFNISHKGN